MNHVPRCPTTEQGNGSSHTNTDSLVSAAHIGLPEQIIYDNGSQFSQCKT